LMSEGGKFSLHEKFCVSYFKCREWSINLLYYIYIVWDLKLYAQVPGREGMSCYWYYIHQSGEHWEKAQNML
jgi:hypothetical protein